MESHSHISTISRSPSHFSGPKLIWDLLHLWWCGAVLVSMAWVTHTSVKATLILIGAYRFWSNMCFHQGNVFIRDTPTYFIKTMPSHILKTYNRMASQSKRAGLRLACLLLKMYCALWSTKYRNATLLINLRCTSSKNEKKTPLLNS